MDAIAEQFAQTPAAGLTIGCVYGLLRVGLAFISGIIEFCLVRGQQAVAAPVMYPQGVQSGGLQAVQHTYLTESFYWDLNDRIRALTARVLPRTSGMPPHMGAAEAYSAVRHDLKTVAALGPAEAKRSGRAAVACMKRADRGIFRKGYDGSTLGEHLM